MNATAVRLDYLKQLLKAEEACKDRSQSYVDDLKVSIKRCETQLKRSGNFEMVNGV